MLTLNQGLIKPLVDLLKSRNMTVQLKVAMALESLAINNQTTQEHILSLDAAIFMIKLVEVVAGYIFLNFKNTCIIF